MDEAYHHGALREALLTEGQRVLLEEGADAVTLRRLARVAGVSHAAPRRHFADREELLDAIAARGFESLTESAIRAGDADDLAERLTQYARTFVRFAADNGPLVALMFGAKHGAAGGPLAEAARHFFATGARLLGEDPSTPPRPQVYLVAATFEGISMLVAAGRLPRERVDEVIATAVAALVPQFEAK
ncbi:TetR/AcrR family transcriptional regulator [Sinomonas susongensis]|uniref:TetR/AcrR family transcriptional regulator n=1 Tax=Sinomonas susongensis TaxID=1324851 RepID=UPI00148734BD|nr:TetR/AcrR family transcriptional regulator [Sinomonas susongensis]